MIFKRNVFFVLVILLFINPFKIVFAEEISSETESFITNEKIESTETVEIIEDTEDISNNEEQSSENLLEEEIIDEKITEEVNEEITKEEIEEIVEETTNEIVIEKEQFTMINLIGLNLNDIYSQINILENNIIINYEINDDLNEDTIIEQSIVEGESYNKESILTLKVSSKSLVIVEEEQNIDLISSFSLNNEVVESEQEIDNQSIEYAETSDVSNSNILLNWDGIPYSYEYNWDNSQNCWNWGVWIGDVCYITPEGTFTTDVRHKMQIYCDNEYVYLHIIYSRNYNSTVNGNDFQFYINGNCAAFQVEDADRNTLANQKYPVGVHTVFISHRNNEMSYSEAIGSEGYLMVSNDDNINNQLEIRIPLSELNRQNSDIDLDNMSLIEFFSPNLMYRRISCAGSNTFGLLVLIPIVILITINIYKIDRKKNFNGKF